MARIRDLHPGFFKNEDLCSLPPHARLLFAGLWCWADREGRLEDRPARLKAEIFPYEPDVEINTLLSELTDHGFIRRYDVNGHHLICIPAFKSKQHPHPRELKSTLPAPCVTKKAGLQQPSENRPATVQQPSGNSLAGVQPVSSRAGSSFPSSNISSEKEQQHHHPIPSVRTLPRARPHHEPDDAVSRPRVPSRGKSSSDLDAVLDEYRDLPGTSGKITSADRALAKDLLDRKIPPETIRDALVLGAARRLQAASPEPIRSLKYFLSIIGEIQRDPPPRGYVEDLRSKLAGEDQGEPEEQES